jgi:hypothetical protein
MPRRTAGVLLLAAVLALHLALLGHAPPGPGAKAGSAPARAAPVVLVAARPPAPAPQVPTPGPPAPAQRIEGLVTQPPVATQQPPRAASAQPTSPPAEAPAAAGAGPANPDTAPPADASPAPQGQPLPLYATRPPPSAMLRYTLQRGPRSVPAQLLWGQDGSGYTLSLATDDGDAGAWAGPLRGLGASSRGSFDAAGLAPERFVDRRRGRDRAAATFQRDNAALLLSASTVPAPLHPGMQDRVSWMLQLAAILEANPALAQPGAHVQLWVAATRGPPQVWDFEVQPAEAGAEPGQPAGLVHLQRRAERPHELQVDAWLDPARHHLPWRVLLSAAQGDWRSDLRLAAP